MSKIATWLGPAPGAFRGHAVHFKVDPPMSQCRWNYDTDEEIVTPHEYIIVSAVQDVPFSSSGPETYIFPANAAGEIVDWGELPGSTRGYADVERVLRNEGYEITWAKEDSGQGSQESLGA
jgi:hypothetical protein